jgi:hypothetical protein
MVPCALNDEIQQLGPCAERHTSRNVEKAPPTPSMLNVELPDAASGVVGGS